MRQPQQIGVIDIRLGEVGGKCATGVLQISTGAERLVARSGQDDDANVLIVMGVAVAFGDAGDHLAVERVALLRSVDGDPERLAALFQDDAVVIGHGSARSREDVPADTIAFSRGVGPSGSGSGWRREYRCIGPFHPDLVVMESRATDRRDRFGAGQHVDAAATDMSLVRMHGFRDQDTAAHALE